MAEEKKIRDEEQLPNEVGDLANDYLEADSIELIKKRFQARQAMTGKNLKPDSSDELNQIAKRREEARVAMEDPQYRHKKQTEKQTEEAERQKTKKIAELKKQRLFKKIEREKEKEKSLQVEKETETKKKQAHLEKLEQSKRLIDQIKESENSQISPLKTLTTDFKNQKNVSLSQIAQKNKPPQKPPQKENKTWGIKLGLTLIIAILLSVSLGGAYLTWSFLSVPGSRTIAVNSLITAAEHQEIRLPEDENSIGEIINNLINQTESTRPNETLTNIYFTIPQEESSNLRKITRKITAPEFLDLLNINWPAEFRHFLLPDFMFGLSEYSIPKSKFFVFTTRSYAHTLDILFRREEEIIKSLFNNSTFRTNLNNLDFQDQIIKNINTKVAKDQFGEIKAIYALIDEITLVITEDQGTFEHLVDIYRRNN